MIPTTEAVACVVNETGIMLTLMGRWRSLVFDVLARKDRLKRKWRRDHFYSNLMNLINPQQTRDDDGWNDTQWMGMAGGRKRGSGNHRRSRSKAKGGGGHSAGCSRTYNSSPASILSPAAKTAALFSCAENTLCRSVPTNTGRRYRDDQSHDSYNFTVETPFTDNTGRSSRRSAYDDPTAAEDTYASTYAEGTYASRSTATSNDDYHRHSRSNGRAGKSKSKSKSRSRSRSRYDVDTVDEETYDDDSEQNSSYY